MYRTKAISSGLCRKWQFRHISNPDFSVTTSLVYIILLCKRGTHRPPTLTSISYFFTFYFHRGKLPRNLKAKRIRNSVMTFCRFFQKPLNFLSSSVKILWRILLRLCRYFVIYFMSAFLKKMCKLWRSKKNITEGLRVSKALWRDPTLFSSQSVSSLDN